MKYTVTPQGVGFAVCADGKVMQTPDKQALLLPTRALAEAIAAEWNSSTRRGEAGRGALSEGISQKSPHPNLPPKGEGTKAKPLTALAYTAIDRIAPQPGNIIEALLVYIDTDTLSYRATGSEKLAAQQEAQWSPVLAWAKKTYGVTWEVTSGVMPLEQPAALTEILSARLAKLDAMRLSACCLLASGFSSLVLMLAVLENYLSAEEAFRLSRLEEESQAEQWGRDVEADIRTARLHDEIMAVKHFLGLLERP